MIRVSLVHFAMIIVVFAYYHACEPCAKRFDKLLCSFDCIWLEGVSLDVAMQ